MGHHGFGYTRARIVYADLADGEFREIYLREYVGSAILMSYELSLAFASY